MKILLYLIIALTAIFATSIKAKANSYYNSDEYYYEHNYSDNIYYDNNQNNYSPVGRYIFKGILAIGTAFKVANDKN